MTAPMPETMSPREKVEPSPAERATASNTSQLVPGRLARPSNAG